MSSKKKVKIMINSWIINSQNTVYKHNCSQMMEIGATKTKMCLELMEIIIAQEILIWLVLMWIRFNNLIKATQWQIISMLLERMAIRILNQLQVDHKQNKLPCCNSNNLPPITTTNLFQICSNKFRLFLSRFSLNHHLNLEIN